MEVKWKDNYNGNVFSDSLSATVTYHKKGDTEKVTGNSPDDCPDVGLLNRRAHSFLVSSQFSEHAERIFVDGFRYYSGKCLEPNTAYVVSVRSYSSWNEKLGDSSEDREFTTGNVHDGRCHPGSSQSPRAPSRLLSTSLHTFHPISSSKSLNYCVLVL